ncbi:MAG: murein hydrolase activator EnvC [Polaribacter sp.]
MFQKRFFISFLLLFFVVVSSFSQTRKQLEAKRLKYKKEIREINNLLFKEKKKEKNALEDLSDLNKKIDVRDKLITTINSESKLISKEIAVNEKSLKTLQKNLDNLKKDYAAMIFKSYKSKSQQSKTMFLLSSKNFQQAYKRLEYMKQYTSFRKKQGEEIIVQTTTIKKFNDSLLYQKQVKDTLILNEKEQKEQIETDKKRKEKLVSTIKKKESKYKRELQKKIKEENKITQRIDKLIRDEIAKANRIAKAKLKTKPKKTKKNEFILSPEAKALAVKFELNKGKLPWPVKESIIVRRFGVQKHPTIGGITINSPGLHFVTKKGNNAEAIFNGKVLNVLVGVQGRKTVIIKHGNYLSSYNNLDNVFVKKGDNVKTAQNIGHIFTDKVSGKTKLVFVLYKNTVKLNPSSWLLKR